MSLVDVGGYGGCCIDFDVGGVCQVDIVGWEGTVGENKVQGISFLWERKKKEANFFFFLEKSAQLGVSPIKS